MSSRIFFTWTVVYHQESLESWVKGKVGFLKVAHDTIGKIIVVCMFYLFELKQPFTYIQLITKNWT